MRLLPTCCVLLALCAAGLLASCDYPEGGYFEISASDGARSLGSFPFAIQEITDDTDLTTGFNILLPRDGQLVVVPLANGTDMSTRNWQVRLADSDSGIGDVQLTLTSTDVLSFAGLFRAREVSQAAAFSGKGVASVSGKVEEGAEDSSKAETLDVAGLPARWLDGKATGAKWQIRRITQASFEKLLGTTVKSAKHREAATLAEMHAPAAATDNSPSVRPGKFTEPTPGGKRTGP